MLAQRKWRAAMWGLILTIPLAVGCAAKVDQRGVDTGIAIVGGIIGKALGNPRPYGRQMRPELLVGPSSLDFGAADVGTETRRVLTVSNSTGTTLAVTMVTFNQLCFALSDSSALPLDILARSEISIDVVFRPVATGLCSGVMLLEVDSADVRFLSVAVRAQKMVYRGGCA